MPEFHYQLKTTYGEAHGSITADDGLAAEKLLAAQYKGGGHVDEDGKKLPPNKVESILLTEVKPVPEPASWDDLTPETS